MKDSYKLMKMIHEKEIEKVRRTRNQGKRRGSVLFMRAVIPSSSLASTTRERSRSPTSPPPPNFFGKLASAEFIRKRIMSMFPSCVVRYSMVSSRSRRMYHAHLSESSKPPKPNQRKGKAEEDGIIKIQSCSRQVPLPPS